MCVCVCVCAMILGCVQGIQYAFCSIWKSNLISIFIFPFFRLCLNIVRSGAFIVDYDVLLSGLVVIKCDHLLSRSTNMIRIVSFSEQNYIDTKEKELI